MLVSADNSFASNVVNLPTSLSLSEVWPSAQVSLIQSNALSGSVDADMTASLVRILQFLWDSAWGKAGILIVAASLTLLLLSLVWSLGMPKTDLIRRTNLRSLSSKPVPIVIVIIVISIPRPTSRWSSAPLDGPLTTFVPFTVISFVTAFRPVLIRLIITWWVVTITLLWFNKAGRGICRRSYSSYFWIGARSLK